MDYVLGVLARRLGREQKARGVGKGRGKVSFFSSPPRPFVCLPQPLSSQKAPLHGKSIETPFTRARRIKSVKN